MAHKETWRQEQHLGPRKFADKLIAIHMEVMPGSQSVDQSYNAKVYIGSQVITSSTKLAVKICGSRKFGNCPPKSNSISTQITAQFPCSDLLRAVPRSVSNERLGNDVHDIASN